MKCIIIFGPPAVGKMSVGKAISEKTGYKLLHNHMTIDLILNFFQWGTPEFFRLDTLFRFEIMKEVAKSDLPGFIFTFMWEFDGENAKEDKKYIQSIEKIFADQGGETVFLELECGLKERLKRNKTPLRLENKPSKRDIAASEKRIIESESSSRLNSKESELGDRKHLKINNENLSPAEVAEKAIKYFNL